MVYDNIVAGGKGRENITCLRERVGVGEGLGSIYDNSSRVLLHHNDEDDDDYIPGCLYR